MSFGWSAGDVAAAIALAFKIADALRDAGGSADQRLKAQAFLQTYQLAISLVQECCLNPTTQTVDPQLEPALRTLRGLDKKLQDRLAKSVGLEKKEGEKLWEKLGRQVAKVVWPFFSESKVQEIRQQIIAQVQVLQPILMIRQSKNAANQATEYHDENNMNFQILKEMINALALQFSKQHSNVMALPFRGPDAGIVADDEEAPFAGYTDAQTVISQYAPRLMPDGTSAALKKLKVNNKLIVVLRTWLLESDTAGHNILWLLSGSAVKLSAIMYSVGLNIQMPVLAYSCRQVDETGRDIPSKVLFTQMVYAFLDGLLANLQSMADADRRIDSSLVAELNGEFGTMSQAIVLLGRLLDNTASACVCIIDNFQRLDLGDDAAVKGLVKDFIGLFRQDARRPSARFSGRHKLLLTSPGQCATLVDMRAEHALEGIRTDDHVDKGRYLVWDELKTASQASRS